MLYQQFTGSPRFLAGENVHCVTAATTASSDARPSDDPRSKLTRCGWPSRETRTRATTIFLSAPAGRLAGRRGAMRDAIRGGSSTSFDSKNRPVSGAGGRADSTADGLAAADAGMSGDAPRATTGTVCCTDRFASRTGARCPAAAPALGRAAGRAVTAFVFGTTFAADEVSRDIARRSGGVTSSTAAVTWTGGASPASPPDQSNPSRRAPSAAPIAPTIAAAAIISIGA